VLLMSCCIHLRQVHVIEYRSKLARASSAITRASTCCCWRACTYCVNFQVGVCAPSPASTIFP